MSTPLDNMTTLEVIKENNKRIEVAIVKLTEISGNLDKMLSVHEQRLNQQEKLVNNIELVLEKRREESESKISDVYDTIKTEDGNILDRIDLLKREFTSLLTNMSKRINALEKALWTSVGIFTFLVFLVSYGHNFLKFLAG